MESWLNAFKIKASIQRFLNIKDYSTLKSSYNSIKNRNSIKTGHSIKNNLKNNSYQIRQQIIISSIRTINCCFETILLKTNKGHPTKILKIVRRIGVNEKKYHENIWIKSKELEKEMVKWDKDRSRKNKISLWMAE